VLHLRELPTPSGGELISLVSQPLTAQTKDDASSSTLIAPTRRGLFLYDQTTKTWRAQTWAQPGLSSRFDNAWRDDNLDSTRFLAHDGRLWWLDGTGPGGSPRLLTSNNTGRSWEVKQLPPPYTNRWASLPSNTNEGGGIDLAQTAPESNLSLFVANDSIYLRDSSELWKLERVADTYRWEEISLTGAPLGPQQAREGFPALVRHYTPATDARDYELLTILSDQLMIYRRAKETESFVLTATLPTVDRAVLVSESGDQIHILTPDALYTSDALAEEWEKVRLVQPSVLGEECEELIETDTALLVSTNTGKLLRGQYGAPSSWETVRDGDLDDRAITSIHRARDGKLYAGTQGLGMLASEDDGKTWSRENNGLNAVRLFALEVDANGKAYLATDAGLFEANPLVEGPLQWRELHDRSTSALHLHDATTWSGTAGGAIAILRPGEEIDVQSSMGDGLAPLFQPSDKRGLALPPEAFLSIQMRESASFIAAFSHQKGVFQTRDGGTSWLQEPRNQALETALDGSHISNWLLAPGTTRYLTSEPLRSELRAQLWRSDDDGATWRSVHTFANQEHVRTRQLFHIPGRSAEDLLLLTPHHLKRSEDGGVSWSTLDGNWGEKRLLALSLKGTRAALLVKDQAIIETLDIEDITAEQLQFTTYQLKPEQGVVIDEVFDVHIGQRAIMLRTRDAIWIASSRDRATELTYNLTILLSVVVTILLGGIAYIIVRRFG
jgi:photosystem II stability/assembly factor-like uncharacterized protein